MEARSELTNSPESSRFGSFDFEQLRSQILVFRERLLQPNLDTIQIEPLVKSLEDLRTELAVRAQTMDPDDPDMQRIVLLENDIDLAFEAYANRAIMGEDAASPAELDK